jgi:type IV fimbrial biogenesis protein FimT
VRQLNPIRRGLTLVELMVAFAIASLLALAATPFFSDYGVNSRLREGGNLVYAEALFAQSEGIKRNRTVQLSTAGGALAVFDLADPANPVVIRNRRLPDNVSVAQSTVNFGSSGWPTDLNAVSINLSHDTAVCDADHRCPGLRVDAGGAIRLCSNKLSC